MDLRQGGEQALDRLFAVPVAQVLDKLHPSGWTDRKTYGLAVLSGAAALVGLNVVAGMAAIPLWIIVVVSTVAFILLALLTVRRLRDAGLSVWLTLLLLFPFGIIIDVATVAVSAFELHLIDLGSVIRSAPILLGLALRSQPIETRMPE